MRLFLSTLFALSMLALSRQDVRDRLAALILDFKHSNGATTIVAAGVIVATISIAFFNYLSKPEGGKESKRDLYTEVTSRGLEKILSELTKQNNEISAAIESKFGVVNELLQEQAEKEYTINFSESKNEKLQNILIESIAKNLTGNFFEHLKNSIKNEIFEDKKAQISLLTKTWENSVSRLVAENKVLAKRANVNLVMGSGIALSALLLLGYFVTKINFDSTDVMQLILRFIPRLSLVIFIEVFAYFFLNLYAKSLQEIKYYQNELTNLEAKGVAILYAASYGTEADITNIIKEMSMTERNFKLLKGESTVEIEKSRAGVHDLKELLRAVVGLKKEK